MESILKMQSYSTIASAPFILNWSLNFKARSALISFNVISFTVESPSFEVSVKAETTCG